jgi:hypothetical protein
MLRFRQAESNIEHESLQIISNEKNIETSPVPSSQVDENSETNLIEDLLIVNKAYQEAIDEKIVKLKKLLNVNIHQQVRKASRNSNILLTSFH